MKSIFRLTALSLALLWLDGAALARDPEFKPAIVTAAWTYDRPRATFNVAGIEAGAKHIATSSVTIALDGLLITGEWQPKTPEDPDSTAFRPGSEVSASVTQTRMLLQLPDGNVVTAKVVYREKQKTRSTNR
jgi:hypothetical protein